MRIAFLLSILLFTGAGNGLGQERFVKFVDEGPSDKSFLEFRTKYIAALQRKDGAFILSVTDPKVINGYGGDDGIENFQNSWKINNPQSDFWDEMLKVMTNGGSFSAGAPNKTFVAPYSFVFWPNDLEIFEHYMIFGNAVALREQPSLESTVITRLSYNVVTAEPEYKGPVKTGEEMRPHYGWMYVRTLGGQTGFVSSKFLRSPIDFRASFEKINGSWRLTAFLVGD